MSDYILYCILLMLHPKAVYKKIRRQYENKKIVFDAVGVACFGNSHDGGSMP